MIGIRADANVQIAMGHIIRCISIALQLEKLGSQVVFIVSEPEAEFLVKEYGFRVECLHNSYHDKEQELQPLFEIIEQRGIEMLFIDSYEVTEIYLLYLQKRLPVVYIDDMNMFQYPVNAIVNYTYGVTLDLYRKYPYTSDVKYALGSKYIPLREQFADSVIKINDEVRNIFITSGGTDPEHMIKTLLLETKKQKWAGIQKTIVVGNFYNEINWLKAYAETHPEITIYKNISNVVDIMIKCDVAISAGGTTLAELCACGIPTIAFSMSDNQIPGVTAYAEDGLLIYAGDIRKNKELVLNNIMDNIQVLMSDKKKRIELSEKAHLKIDGKGARRIAEFLIKFEKDK